MTRNNQYSMKNRLHDWETYGKDNPVLKPLFEMVEMHKRQIVLHEEELQKAQAEERKAKSEYKALMKDIKERVRKLNEKKKRSRN